MTNVQLKNYQVKTLDSLKEYLTAARFKGAKAAYEGMEKKGVVNVRPYNALVDLPDAPYVCLRLPTGGGKTLLAAHSVRVASLSYLERDFPVVLWLVPTKTIKQQTLEVLKTPGNANYETLRTSFDGNFRVVDIADFTLINPHDLESKAVVIVSTMASLRVDDTEGRKVYDHHEDLEPHFRKISANTSGLEKNGEGQIKFSFANLLHVYRPLILVDEAQNFSTTLSGEVKKRVNASCVIEFTATPPANSNILHSVSARELKAEEMIKLPIVLTEHGTWEEAVRDAVLNRKRLEGLCANEDRYIRPIVLFQAESKGEENVTWDKLKAHLLQSENIDESKIAVVTGDQRELDGINLFDSNCPIEFVITVQALKEGWDCSFAYVFCSVASINSAKDVEQLLGRVLRMPYAKRRTHEDLNRAYAHVSSTSWPNAVKKLSDRLVQNMGFEADEIDESLETRQAGFKWNETEPFPQPDGLVLELTAAPVLAETDKKVVEIEKKGEVFIATVIGAITPEAQKALIDKVATEEKPNAKVELQLHQATFQRYIAPVNRGEKFAVPQLCLRLDGELELPDAGTFLYAGNWQLKGHAELTDLTLQEDGKTFSIDIEEGHVRHSYIASTQQANLDLVDMGVNINALSQILDRRLRQADVSQPQMLEFIRKTLEWLQAERNIPLPALVRGRFLVQKVLETYIRKLRQEARARGFQALLFDNDAKPEVSFDYSLNFLSDTYYPQHRYHGAFRPTKHFYAVIGEMNGEEAECAKVIEMLGDKVKYWVRNLERDPQAFRLPTSTDYFYPDFVVMLADGRILVIEYKGEQFRGTDDVKEKQNIGELWAKQSKGKGLFLMAWKDNSGKSLFEQVKSILGA